MRLCDLLGKSKDCQIPNEFAQNEINSISSDSRSIQKNSLFVATKGAKLNGIDFIEDAIHHGTCVIAAEEKDLKNKRLNIPQNVCVIKVKNSNQFLREIVGRFYGYPSQVVKVIGITGTNGKTTVSYLLESIIGTVPKKCGVIGTINHRIAGKILPAKNTTPGFIDNQKYLKELVNQNIEYCVMEVSSHALIQGRVDLIDFKSAIFTNLTSDHLDYHSSQEEYFLAKAKLFINLNKKAVAIINGDDGFVLRIPPLTKAKVVKFGFTQHCQVRAENIRLGLNGSQFDLLSPQGKIEIRTPLIGQHNIYNILAAAGASLEEGFSLRDIKSGIEKLIYVPGRLQAIPNKKGFHIFIDYAHTEDGLKNVLESLRRTSKSKIILVFGCGGDRDKTKRPQMAKVACDLADFSIVTSDNPRTEDPQAIINDILKGFKKNNYKVILQRQEAIKEALTLAQKGDIVLIAGKGHENYQIFKDRTIDFDEFKIVQTILDK